MKTVDINDAKGELGEYAAHVADDPVIVTNRGRPVAALVSIENADLETVSLSTNPKFVELIQRSRAHHGSQGGISSNDMRRRLEIDTDEK
jgi:prevent-host-death family protein